MKAEYPNGATWEGVGYDSDGNICCYGKVWVESIRKELIYIETFQIWHWEATYKNGSGREFDWRTSRKTAVEDAKLAMVGMGAVESRLRFKRVKGI